MGCYNASGRALVFLVRVVSAVPADDTMPSMNEPATLASTVRSPPPTTDPPPAASTLILDLPVECLDPILRHVSAAHGIGDGRRAACRRSREALQHGAAHQDLGPGTRRRAATGVESDAFYGAGLSTRRGGGCS